MSTAWGTVDGRRLPVFLCAAVALHVAVAGWLSSKAPASPHSAERVISISLLPLTGQLTRQLASDTVSAPVATTTGAPAVFDLLVSSATDPPVAAAQPMPPAEGGGSSSSIDRSGDAGLDNYFYSVAELTRLPGLPGDPVIDLGALSEELIGRLELRLFIDANGRVVKKRIEGDSGWPNSIVDAVARAFAGYPYVPGQRHGVAVNSQVVLLIQVREGQISAGVTQEFGPN